MPDPNTICDELSNILNSEAFMKLIFVLAIIDYLATSGCGQTSSTACIPLLTCQSVLILSLCFYCRGTSPNQVSSEQRDLLEQQDLLRQRDLLEQRVDPETYNKLKQIITILQKKYENPDSAYSQLHALMLVLPPIIRDPRYFDTQQFENALKKSKIPNPEKFQEVIKKLYLSFIDLEQNNPELIRELQKFVNTIPQDQPKTMGFLTKMMEFFNSLRQQPSQSPGGARLLTAPRQESLTP